MIPNVPFLPSNRHIPSPLVLVADDDARVLELLKIAFTTHHYRVITASDGDEAIRRALGERPDAVVLDVRMPRKGGLEVCDYLRHEPEDPHVPIVLVSASGDTEARLEGLAHGADDYLAKPFSPKELVARVQRLLTRSGEARMQRRRATELEHELGRAQDETRRVQQEMKREQRLRQIAFGIGRELQRMLDADELADRLLLAAQRQLGAGAVALLSAADPDVVAPFVVHAVRGDGPDRFGALQLDPLGDLFALVSGLGRPVPRQELERFPEMRAELAPFIAAGVALVAPLRGPLGLEGVIVADERQDGAGLTGSDLEAMAALCDLAATALHNAKRFRATQDRAIEIVAERAVAHERMRGASAEALEIARGAMGRLGLPARERGLVRHAVSLGAWGWSDEGRRALAALEDRDPTHRVRSLRELVGDGESLALPDGASCAERHATLVTGACVRYAVARASGRSPIESWSTSMSWAGANLDRDVREAMERTFASLTGTGPTSNRAA